MGRGGGAVPGPGLVVCNTSIYVGGREGEGEVETEKEKREGEGEGGGETERGGRGREGEKR